MFHYVYQITNLVNGKIYIGKRSSKNDPKNDPYMGSGTQIKRAIKKYGVENFTKEVLGVFENADLALQFEEQLVTPEFLLREDTYNMRKGGIGGFEHINNDPTKRAEVSEKSRRSNIAAGRGGSKNWTEEGRKRVREQAIKNHIRACELSRSPEAIAKRKATCKERGVGLKEKNGQFGTHFYVPVDCLDDVKDRKRFKEGHQPEGWITTTEFRNNKKNKNKGATGRHWYNDGERNFFLMPDDKRTSHLTKGRINTNGCCGFNSQRDSL